MVEAKKANHLKSRAPTQSIICFGSRTEIVCLLPIFCGNKKQSVGESVKEFWQPWIKMLWVVLTLLLILAVDT